MSKYRLWKQARADSGGWDRKTDGFGTVSDRFSAQFSGV